MAWSTRHFLMAGISFALVSCGQSNGIAEKSEVETANPVAIVSSAAPTTGAFSWPSSLRVMGDGYPTSGAPCRRIGETSATVNYLDDSASLIGCPGSHEDPAARAIVASEKGKVVGTVDGVTLISVP